MRDVRNGSRGTWRYGGTLPSGKPVRFVRSLLDFSGEKTQPYRWIPATQREVAFRISLKPGRRGSSRLLSPAICEFGIHAPAPAPRAISRVVPEQEQDQDSKYPVDRKSCKTVHQMTDPGRMISCPGCSLPEPGTSGLSPPGLSAGSGKFNNFK